MVLLVHCYAHSLVRLGYNSECLNEHSLYCSTTAAQCILIKILLIEIYCQISVRRLHLLALVSFPTIND